MVRGGKCATIPYSKKFQNLICLEKILLFFKKITAALKNYDFRLPLSNYHIGDKTTGRIGIIGPTRMNYSKVVANINQISQYLEKLLNEIYFDDNGE